MGVGLALAFCKCADVCWQKKRLEKRINFALGKGELFFIVVMFLCILDCTFHRIADNGLGIAEGGDFSRKSSIEELPLNLALNPPFCQTAVVRLCFFQCHNSTQISLGLFSFLSNTRT